METEREMPRWSVAESDVFSIAAGWRAWLQSIAEGYFGKRAPETSRQCILIEGLAMGIAWLLRETERQRAIRGKRVVDTAHRKGAFGPGRDLHDVLRESIANSALRTGRDFMQEYLGALAPWPAALTVATGALKALAEGDRAQEGRAARDLFLLELGEQGGQLLFRSLRVDAGR